MIVGDVGADMGAERLRCVCSKVDLRREAGVKRLDKQQVAVKSVQVSQSDN